MNASGKGWTRTGRIDVLPPERPKAAERRNARPAAGREVVDAEFVVIARGRARATNDEHRRKARPNADAPAQHILLRLAAAAMRLGERGLQRLPARAFNGLIATIVVFVFATAGGLSALRAALPGAPAASPIAVTGVSASLADSGGMKVLSVYGRLDNASADAQALPSLDIRVESRGTTQVRQVALDTSTIAAKGSQDFAFRFPHAGAVLPKVSVSLVAKRASAD